MIKLLYIQALLYATAGEVVMAQDSKDLSMLVGTYTDTQSHGIYSFRFDQQTGLRLFGIRKSILSGVWTYTKIFLCCERG